MLDSDDSGGHRYQTNYPASENEMSYAKEKEKEKEMRWALQRKRSPMLQERVLEEQFWLDGKAQCP